MPAAPQPHAGHEFGHQTGDAAHHHPDIMSPPNDVTVIDFAADSAKLRQFPYTDMQKFLEEKTNAGGMCQWICMNAVNHDAILALAKAKELHPLAVEDVLSRVNRTKVEWYSDDLYAVLPLHKLITRDHGATSGGSSQIPHSKDAAITEGAGRNSIVTLQRRRNPRSENRVKYMEDISPLSRRQLGVSVEQVSIFMLDNNTVVSIFERSAADVLRPLAARLFEKNTILRRSADASLLFQAIIDAIVDMAIPITLAYQESIAELEYQVLSNPHIEQPRQLYALSSEINQLQLGMRPLAQVVGSLCAHPTMSPGLDSESATISPLAQMYFRDVEDHIVLIVTSFDGMIASTGNLTTLIYNQLGTSQNDSINRLTLFTIFFLPLTFLTSYFGMNFEEMWTIQHSEFFFWGLTLPIMLVTTFFLNRWLKRTTTLRVRTKH